MTYADACKVDIDDAVIHKGTNNRMVVLEIEKDNDSNNIFFRCYCCGKISLYHHTAVRREE